MLNMDVNYVVHYADIYAWHTLNVLNGERIRLLSRKEPSKEKANDWHGLKTRLLFVEKTINHISRVEHQLETSFANNN